MQLKKCLELEYRFMKLLRKSLIIFYYGFCKPEKMEFRPIAQITQKKFCSYYLEKRIYSERFKKNIYMLSKHNKYKLRVKVIH